MKTIIPLLLAVTLTGCASIPSRWDPNQSAKFTDISQSVQNLDCAGPHLPQVNTIRYHLQWFEIYSQSRNHQDMLELIAPLQESVQEFWTRSQAGNSGEVYCDIKKELLIEQTTTAHRAIQRRF
jgi:hypothetical protein